MHYKALNCIFTKLAHSLKISHQFNSPQSESQRLFVSVFSVAFQSKALKTHRHSQLHQSQHRFAPFGGYEEATGTAAIFLGDFPFRRVSPSLYRQVYSSPLKSRVTTSPARKLVIYVPNRSSRLSTDTPHQGLARSRSCRRLNV